MAQGQDQNLTYDEVVVGRRSTRGFLPDAIPKAVIREILEIAMRAPSAFNSHPCHFLVVSGERRRFKSQAGR
jgi:nitroreductase